MTALQHAQRRERGYKDKAWACLNILAKFGELDIEDDPDIITVVSGMTKLISITYFRQESRADYLRITRFWRKALKASISKFENGYDTQRLDTKGSWKWHGEEFKVNVSIDIGIREGGTLTYEDKIVSRPVITCA